MRLHVVKLNGPPTQAGSRWAADAVRAQARHLWVRIERRDPQLAEHGRVVGQYAAMTARALGVPLATTSALRLAGELHDVGKLELPTRILQKPGELDEREWAWVKTHPTVGAAMIREAGFDQIADWVFSHHERADGGGYPLGLKSNAIPLESSILAVADAYHAMTSDRPYSGAMSPPDALEELRRGAGVQFDPVVVDAFAPAMAETLPDTADL